jgi:hypothetical protein
MDRSILRHRGPDDEGPFLAAGGGTGLVNTRLSILDLSTARHRSMASGAAMRVLHAIRSLSVKEIGPSLALPVVARALRQGVEVTIATTDDSAR